jgi:ankyrin repeat protein
MDMMEFRKLIEAGDVDAVQNALASDRELANKTVIWGLKQECRSDPLHFVCDCVAEEWISDEKAAELAQVLLAHGATVDGANGSETPLLGATSLGAEKVANILIESGANVDPTSVFGAGPLHWAAYMGLPSTVEMLIRTGAAIEARCTEFGATPLFWAAHGFGPRGPDNAKGQIAAVRGLIGAGATIDTTNKDGLTAIDCSRRAKSSEMHDLLVRSKSSKD